jgi:hypothetical protein
MATEEQYDEIIAPMMLAVAKRCEELGMSLIARIEWEPGESGITQIGDMNSAGQWLTQMAAHSHGNIDKLCLIAVKTKDVSASMFLHSYVRTETAQKQPAASETNVNETRA